VAMVVVGMGVGVVARRVARRVAVISVVAVARRVARRVAVILVVAWVDEEVGEVMELLVAGRCTECPCLRSRRSPCHSSLLHSLHLRRCSSCNP